MTNIRSSLVVLSLALLAVTTGCNRDDPDNFLQSGKDFLEKKDYKAAVIELKNALQGAPQNGEARYLLAQALVETGEARDAEIELRKAAEAGYDPNLVQPALASALRGMGEAAKALDVASSATLTEPGAKARMQSIVGSILLGRGKISEARDAFTQALEHDPSNVDAKLGLARLATTDGGIAEAEKQVDALITQSPAFADALLFKAQLLVAQGKAAESIQVLGRAVDARPNSIAAHMSLVPALLRTGDVAGARARVDALKNIARDSVAPLYLDALVLSGEGKLIEARDAAENALKYAPDYPPLLLLAGTLAMQQRNLAEAEEHLTKAAKAVPNGYAQRLLVGTLLQAGKPQRAKELLDPPLEARPDDPGLVSLAAELAMGRGDYKEATKLYSKALAGDPKNVVRQTRLGQAMVGSGDVEHGVQVLESAAQNTANNIQADLSLIAVHMNKREPEKAKAALETLLQKQPDNPVAHNMKGLVLMASRDNEGARKSFERALELQPTFFPAAANLAQMDVRQGNQKAALGRYQSILQKDPKQEQALLATVLLLQQSNALPAEVEKALDRAVEGNPSSVSAHLAKINYMLGQRRMQDAVTAAQTAVAVRPDSVQILEALGRAQLAAGDSNQALGSFGKLAALQPKGVRPLLLQAEAHAASKDWASARASLEKALKLEPGARSILLSVVNIEARAGNVEKAVAAARVIQKQYPKESLGYGAEADVYANARRLKEVETSLRAGMEEAPDVNLAARLWLVLTEQKRTAEADAVVREWIGNNPKNAALQNYIASQYTARSNWAEAARWNRESLKVIPDSPATINNLAWALAQLKDPSALQHAEKALTLAPNSPAILDTVGWIHLQQGDSQKAAEALRKAHGLAPNQALIRLHLAEALLKAGEKKEAHTHFEELDKLPESSPIRQEAQKLLGRS